MSIFNRFKLQGNVSTAIRSEEEMKHIDKTIADNAFKLQKKRMDDFMLANGFIKYKSNSYLKWNGIDVLEYVDLQKERYGSKTFTINYALIPLYVPHDFFSFDLGGRLGTLMCGKDVWWDYSEEVIAEISFDNVMNAITEFLLPWFEKNSNYNALMKTLLEEKKKRERHGGRLSDIQQLWVDALREATYSIGVINENKCVFKLPAQINKQSV